MSATATARPRTPGRSGSPTAGTSRRCPILDGDAQAQAGPPRRRRGPDLPGRHGGVRLMGPGEPVSDSPSGWVAGHIRRYVDSDGAKGHEWRPGVYTLLLTTRGRRSGQLRRTALIYGRDGDRYLVVASVGGS